MHPVQAAHHRAQEAAQRWTIFGGTRGKVACAIALVGIGLVVANRFLSNPVLDAVAKPLASPRTGGFFLLSLSAIWVGGVRVQRREVREAKRDLERRVRLWVVESAKAGVEKIGFVAVDSQLVLRANQLLKQRRDAISSRFSPDELVAMVEANEIPEDCEIEGLSVEEVRARIGEEGVNER